MINPNLGTYSFLPWVRQGMATAIPNQDTLSSNVAGSVTLPVTLRMNQDQVEFQIRLYGPGDLTGIDPRQVVRTEPRHLTTDFEPNYFPAIEFDRPDFPWLFTPARANASGRLRPWICLVVVRKQEGVTFTSNPSRPLPMLEIKDPAHPREELPDLAESWAWAHAQITGSLNVGPTLDQVAVGNPERTVSRLLCPRKLEPKTQYYACLVPTFETGRKAGLGEPVTSDDEKELRPAWSSGDSAPDQIQLPVYYHWEFSTGAVGDFEELVRRLEARPIPPEVGLRNMDVSAPGYGLPSAGVILGLEGALRSPQTQPTDWPGEVRKPFQDKLREILNSPETYSSEADSEETGSEPVVAPPIYGRWHAAQRTVPADGDPPRWLRELNLDPRHRAAAGFGTLVVQDQQEQLMASAWEQLGETDRANQVLRQAQFAREVGLIIHEKRLRNMQADLLIQVTGPVHARVRMSSHTFHHQVRQSTLPEAAVMAPFRRIVRPRGPLARRQLPEGQRWRHPFVQRLAEREIAGAPPRMPPGGMVTPDDVSDSFRSGVGPWPVPDMRFSHATPQTVRAVPGRPNFTVVLNGGRVSQPSPIAGRDNLEAARFREAAQAHQARLMDYTKITDPPPKPFLQVAEIQRTLLERLDPSITIPNRIRDRIRIPDGVWKHEDPLEPIMAAPRFPQPMYEPLRAVSQDLLLPGLERIPPNTVTLLETNSRFIEAYMLGLNHEMSRELLWREYPTDQRGTYFQQFWDVRGRIPPPENDGDLKDIPPILKWNPDNPLGKNATGVGAKGMLVLLIRGELLRRYPTATIYAVKAVWSPDRTRRLISEDQRYPLFRGTLEPDVTFLGLDLTVNEARGTTDPADDDPGWYFVIQEQPSEPRFGLDVATSFGEELSKPTSWSELSWGHLVKDETAFRALTHITEVGVIEAPPDTSAITDPPGVAWGANSAHMAYITLQRPVRIAIHADTMLPTEQEEE